MSDVLVPLNIMFERHTDVHQIPNPKILTWMNIQIYTRMALYEKLNRYLFVIYSSYDHFLSLFFHCHRNLFSSLFDINFMAAFNVSQVWTDSFKFRTFLKDIALLSTAQIFKGPPNVFTCIVYTQQCNTCHLDWPCTAYNLNLFYSILQVIQSSRPKQSWSKNYLVNVHDPKFAIFHFLKNNAFFSKNIWDHRNTSLK